MDVELVCKTLARAIPGKRLGVAVSGGADSVALLRLLHNAKKFAEFHICVLHVDHHYRAESSEDARWVKALAGKLQTDFRLAELPVPKKTELADKGFEAWAREKRLEAFASMAVLENLDAVCTAHHAGDQAETFLWRLIRGASLQGLGGIRTLRKINVGKHFLLLWRPLLEFTPGELREMLDSMGQDWREDSSNQDFRFLRNRIRHELLPLLEKFRPGTIGRIGKSATDIGNVQRFLEGNALRRIRKIDSEKCRDPLKFGKSNNASTQAITVEQDCFFPVPGKIPDILLREMLRIWFINNRIGDLERFDRKLLERMIDLLKTSKCGRMMKVGNKKIVRSTRGLEIIPVGKIDKPENTVVRIEPDEVRYFGNRPFFLGSEKPSSHWDGVWLKTEEISLPVEIRFRRPGDRLRPLGGRGEKKLARWLIDKKISSHLRDRLLLIASGNQVLWIPGVVKSRFVNESASSGGIFLGTKENR